ncbi:MAG: phosphoglycerate dehydrogenase [Zetaproteobacteria bacterium]|nr:MAG: phosphoglycerate dehydrogenase [Zetaproteobacteria bacterium]
MARVWIADAMSARALAVFREHGIEVDYRPGLSEGEKLAIVGAYDGIVVRSSTQLKGELLDAAKRVQVIGRAGIGVDNIDVEACSRRGIVVMNTPLGNTITTAELAIAHIVAAARMIPQACASTKAGKWEKSRFMGKELTGKKAGVIGAGNIGSIVCERLKGLHLSVYVYDPFISDERAEAMGITKVGSVEELASMVDVLTIHVPLLKSTRHLINADVLASMKKGAILVNCARGGIVDEQALYEACKSGHLFAACLDVFEQEPARQNPLFELDNVICTPHIGASTEEAQENVAVQVAEQMANYLLRGIISNAVNVPSLTEEEQRLLAPYMLLCERMGQFLGQTMRPGYSRVKVTFEGQAAKLNRKVLINTLLSGLLSQSFEEVNVVNAAMLARDRGMEIIEKATDRSGSFATLIRFEVEGDEGHRCVSGTLFDGQRPRLVSFDTCEVEIAPTGNLIYLHNEDRPGVIAAVGSILAEAGINIGDFRLGRREDTKRAVALVHVDTAPDQRVLDELAELPSMLMVRYAELGAM